jgi:hypothetical protein
MPDLEAAYQKHQGQLVILGVNLQESPTAIHRFLSALKDERTEIDYPVLLDLDGQVKAGYNVFAQPASYFVDERGRIWGKKYGAFTSDELKQRIAEFLGGVAPTGQFPSDQGLEVAYHSGDLSGRYFSKVELQGLGLAGDPAQVRYGLSLQTRSLKTMLTPDSIPSIDTPSFESASQADRWLQDDDLVLTVIHQNIVKAYPIPILNWHEIVNDQSGDLPVTITFCPLCHSGIVFERPTIDGKLETFGTSGRLYQSDLVMYDRVTGSFWSQIEGQPLVGPLVGRFGHLKQIPAGLTSWGAWKHAHPRTLVLARPLESETDIPGLRRYLQDNHIRNPWAPFQRDYTDNPYENYVKSDHDTFGTPLKDERLRAKAIISGLVIGGQAKAYLKEAVARVGLLNDVIDGTPVLVLWDPRTKDVVFFARTMVGQDQPLEFTRQGEGLIDGATQTLWTWDGEALSGPLAVRHARLERLIGITAFWFAWTAFHPGTELYAPTQETQ